MTTDTLDVRLSTAWVDDALSRDLDIGEVVAVGAVTTRLRMTADQMCEAHSAAGYDAELGEHGGCCDDWERTISRAARRVAARIDGLLR